MRSASKLKAEKTTKRQPPKRQPALASEASADAVLEQQDAQLDEALDETFPASDPVALTQPSLRRRAALRRERERRT